jgi:hypothetical protein
LAQGKDAARFQKDMNIEPLKTACRLPKGSNCLHNPEYLEKLFELQKKRGKRKAKVYKQEKSDEPMQKLQC